MGVRLFGSSSWGRSEQGVYAPGDPVPSNFRIVRLHVGTHHIAAEILWPDASNYEGRKVLVYKTDTTLLLNAKELDPHFQEDRGELVPIARFEPTQTGWRMATELVAREDGIAIEDLTAIDL